MPNESPPQSTTEIRQPSLTQKATTGVFWAGFVQVARQILSLASATTLARHIAPEEFGLMGMAAVVTGFLEVFRDVGTTAALIREKSLSDEIISTVFWLNGLFGILLTMIVVLLSFSASWFFSEPQLGSVLQVLSLTFILMSLGVIPNALLVRAMSFQRVMLVQLAGSVAGIAVAIPSAILGAGVWSLVFASLANTTVTTTGFWLAYPRRYPFLISWEKAKPIISFSLSLSGFNVLNYFSRNADNLIVGRFLGKGQLGFYQWGYTLMTYPLANFSSVICQVMYPALTKVQNDDAQFRSAFCRLCSLISLVTFPAMLGLLVTAKQFVYVLLGKEWDPVVGLLVIFAPLGMAQSVFTAIGLIYNSKGRTDVQLRWGIISSISYVLAFLIGLPWGIQGVAASYAIVWALLMIPGLLLAFRLIDLPLGEFFSYLTPILGVSLGMAACSFIWLQTLHWTGIENMAVQFLSTVVVGVLSYLALLWLIKPRVLREVKYILEQSGNSIANRLAGKL